MGAGKGEVSGERRQCGLEAATCSINYMEERRQCTEYEALRGVNSPYVYAVRDGLRARVAPET